MDYTCTAYYDHMDKSKGFILMYPSSDVNTARKVALGLGANFERCNECRETEWSSLHLDAQSKAGAMRESREYVPGSRFAVVCATDTRWAEALGKYNKDVATKFLADMCDIHDPTDREIVKIITAASTIKSLREAWR